MFQESYKCGLKIWEKQAEAEVVPSSSLVEIDVEVDVGAEVGAEVEVGVEVEGAV